MKAIEETIFPLENRFPSPPFFLSLSFNLVQRSILAEEVVERAIRNFPLDLSRRPRGKIRPPFKIRQQVRLLRLVFAPITRIFFIVIPSAHLIIGYFHENVLLIPSYHSTCHLISLVSLHAEKTFAIRSIKRHSPSRISYNFERTFDFCSHIVYASGKHDNIIGSCNIYIYMFEKSVFSCNFLYVNNQDRLIQTASTSTSKMFREKCLPLFIASVSPPPDETINVTECTKPLR